MFASPCNLATIACAVFVVHRQINNSSRLAVANGIVTRHCHTWGKRRETNLSSKLRIRPCGSRGKLKSYNMFDHKSVWYMYDVLVIYVLQYAVGLPTLKFRFFHSYPSWPFEFIMQQLLKRNVFTSSCSWIIHAENSKKTTCLISIESSWLVKTKLLTF